jgi:phasin
MDPKIDVPQPVREFAQNSVDQAEKALASFMEAAGKSAAMVPTPMADVAKQALSITEANLRASLEHARKLLQAKDFNEVMQLHSEFLRNQYQAAAEQFKQMANTSSSPASNAANKTST